MLSCVLDLAGFIHDRKTHMNICDGKVVGARVCQELEALIVPLLACRVGWRAPLWQKTQCDSDSVEHLPNLT